MTLFHLFLVAAIQGLTEFLPISSSAHLILLPQLTGMEDQGLVIDVAVHVGTLFAVMFYFNRDVAMALSGIPRLLVGKVDTPGARLAFLLVVATIPAVILGLAIKLAGLDAAMRDIGVIGTTMLIFGLVLYWTDQRGAVTKAAPGWTTRDAVVMGLWQALALIPGTSRSGVTISAARALGYARYDAAKLAMLMSIPAIGASGTLLAIEVAATANGAAARDGAIAAVMAFVAALLALAVMMRLLRTVSFTPYVIYRVILGGILIAMALAGGGA